jgi:putative CocE/NonD family hydrolase
MSTRVIVDRDVMVPMRDGVRLATDVYRPAEEGQYPVLVHRTPYGKSTAINVAHRFFNPLDAVVRGYAVAIQDVRGRFNSEGEWLPFTNERGDGYDAVEWAAAQPWCDGGAAIYGGSYVGITALHAAASQPPHLKAAMVSMAPINPHSCWIYVDGAFELGLNLFWIGSPFWGLAWDALKKFPLSDEEIAECKTLMAQMTADPWAAVRHLPITDQPVFKKLATYWQDWIEHPDYDDYWKNTDVRASDAQISVPVLNHSGWYDIFLRGAMELHEYLGSHSPESVRDKHRLVIGPWEHASHLTNMPSTAGAFDFGPDALAGPRLWTDLVLNFFDEYLKPDAPPSLPSQVRYFMMGDNEWVDANDWPPKNTPTSFYLHSGGSANTLAGDGVLTAEAPGSEPHDSFVYDPADPVPSNGGSVLFYHPAFGPAGVADQSALEQRQDVLVYTTAVLDEPVVIAGHVSVTLFASTDVVDTDFTGKLIDVLPDGFCANIAQGLVRGRYRNGPQARELLEPGQVYEFTINMWDVAHTFKPGHRIRLEISSSNFPHFDRNLNAAVSPETGTAEDIKIAHQSVLHDAVHPSSLTLPVVA